MAATAEQLSQPWQAEHALAPPIPLVEIVPEMEADQLVRARAARFIGACVANDQIERPLGIESNLTVQPIESLYDAVKRAAEGDPTARSMVETNVRTDVIERTIKAGHVISVDLHVDEAGRIQQHGQKMETVQANSLRLASSNWQMRERTEAEATNAFRIEQLHREGKLEEYSFVVFSQAADNMTEQEMSEAGFFTDTMSCAIQVTTKRGNRLVTESAFVAGVKNPGEDRHDDETIAATAGYFGANLRGKTAAQRIAMPLLIHNSLIPDGAIDLVKIFDKQNGETFFGEDRPTEDYLEYRAKCQEREQMLQPKVNAIVEELISEALGIASPLEAVRRLNKLSGKHMVEQAAFDHSINPLVFGPTSAAHIEEARIQFELGNNMAGLKAVKEAKATDASASCPSGLKSPNGSNEFTDSVTENEAEKDDGECDYISKECPVCHTKNVKTHVTKSRITGSCGCSVAKK